MSAGADGANRGLLNAGPMGRTQVLVIAFLGLLNATDGFDVLAISFAAPSIAQELGLTPARLGLLFSSGFMGMAFGAFVLAPVSDALGRKPVLLLCLSLMTVGMFLTAQAQSFAALTACRFGVGIGVGAMLPTVNTLVAEFANARRRGLAVSVAQTGFGVGGLVGGVIAGVCIAQFGWRSIFLIGAAASFAFIPVVAAYLPESPDWLSQSRSRTALARLNKVLSRVGRPPLQSLPPAAGDRPLRVRPQVLLSGALLRPTVFLSLCYFLSMAAFYSFLNWFPKLMVQQGAAVADAVHLVTLATAGSLLGGLAFGLFARGADILKLTLAAMFSAAGVMAMFALAERTVVLGTLSFAFGALMSSAMVGVATLLAQAYRPAIRATAAGVGMGAGRIGAMFGPAACGFLLGAGLGERWTFPFMAALIVAAGCALVGLGLGFGRARSPPNVAAEGA